MMKYLLSFVFLICSLRYSNAQTYSHFLPKSIPNRTVSCSAKDSTLFYQKIKKLKNTNTLADRTFLAAKLFIGTPYVAGALEGREEEHLIINLRELDCWTLIEYCLALALATEPAQPSFQEFMQIVQQLRYTDGIINGYGSRSHYFSDWILQAEKKGLVKDITQELGGVPYSKKISYMTDNPKLYPKINYPETLQQIQEAQNRINQHPRFFIPQNQVPYIEKHLRNGDILLFTSSKSTLDVEHQGFAFRDQNGVIRLLHASTTGKKVTIASRPLSTYIWRYPAMSGLIVVRVQN
jgi:hypothetical protein